MDLNFILRSGKYAGYTAAEIRIKDPYYFNWIRENRPEMLKSHGKSKSTNSYKQSVYQQSTYKPVQPKTEPVDNDISKTIEPYYPSPDEAF